MFAFMCTPWLIVCVLDKRGAELEIVDYEKAYSVILMMGCTVITLILSYSIWRIRKFSKLLIQSNIFANECLMISHLAGFAFLTLITFYFQCSEFIDLSKSSVQQSSLSQMSERQKRVLLAGIVIQYFYMVACLWVAITMLIMFFKHSEIVSKSQ